MGLAVAAAATLATAPPAVPRSAPAARAECPRLSAHLPWPAQARARLQRVIDERGVCSPAWRADDRPVAAFDWDNTVVKNDATDLTLAWALRHDKLLRPADWAATSPWLTPAATRALTRACRAGPARRPLPTSTRGVCAGEIIEIREKGRTVGGEAAFAGRWHHRRTMPRYAWVAQLFAGRTPAQLRAYAARARDEALALPVGSQRTLGGHTLPAYSRYYPQQRDLIWTLRRAGFAVYVVSAGVEPVTEAWAAGVGIDRAHTLAIRSVLRDGRITTGIHGCGGVPTGHGEVIPYLDGKRCAVNERVLGVRGRAAWRRQPPERRIALGAGDADTDVTFVNDATGAHLAINRNQPELMCRAYDDADGRWAVTPMFLDPLPRRTTPYPCSTAGRTRAGGDHGPLRRADGSVVPDQWDTAHPED
ncbi:haloacid dehalogenase-like hydrolase [Streptomyces sp. AJS327]|uniref:haloacid dehalogenase-like hydrolase n=1 Tax=Streptomyces sp. AJS327 TaxID=2545265 RepID=UPI0015DE3B35|nr:haloacid dehalogenase-like hydrolase [Streptomyces sp. AJS327]MBA0050719.1 haloacid dehalogenase-like hydrolase [Streptomyces sp. AJS327]